MDQICSENLDQSQAMQKDLDSFHSGYIRGTSKSVSKKGAAAKKY
jgi:hypothetical protein